jgi:hypothetical protein
MKTREFVPMSQDKEEYMKAKALKRKMKLVEKIKMRKRDLHDQEYRQNQFEKREKKRAKRGNRPLKRPSKNFEPQQKKVKSKKIHGKNSMFTQEL